MTIILSDRNPRPTPPKPSAPSPGRNNPSPRHDQPGKGVPRVPTNPPTKK